MLAGVVFIGISSVLFKNIPPPAAAGGGLLGLGEAMELFVAGRLVAAGFATGGVGVGAIGIWCLSR